MAKAVAMAEGRRVAAKGEASTALAIVAAARREAATRIESSFRGHQSRTDVVELQRQHDAEIATLRARQEEERLVGDIDEMEARVGAAEACASGEPCGGGGKGGSVCGAPRGASAANRR